MPKEEFQKWQEDLDRRAEEAVQKNAGKTRQAESPKKSPSEESVPAESSKGGGAEKTKD